MADVVRHDLHFSRRLRTRYKEAVLRMSTTPSPGYANAYEKYISIHDSYMPSAHRGLAFLAWHRAFLWEFERDLQAADVALGNDGVLGVPWWNWVRDRDTDPQSELGKTWRDDVLGPSGTSPPFQVRSGPFVAAAWPAPAVVIARVGAGLPFLRRRLGGGGSAFLPTNADISHLLRETVHDLPPFVETPSPPGPITSVVNPTFRTLLEGSTRRTGGTSFMHNSVHGWVSGNMDDVHTSPYDPVFWVHHANVDRIWARWQLRNPRFVQQWPLEGQIRLISLSVTTAGAGYTNGTYAIVPLTTLTGTGSGALASITVAGGAVTTATIISGGSGYAAGNTLKGEPAALGGGTPSTTMVLTIPVGGTESEIDAAFPTPGPPRPPRVTKLDEPLQPWDGSGGMRLWTPRTVLAWQTMGPAGQRYRYSTDPPGSFRFT